MLLRVSLTAETPLSFRTGRNPARSETLLYVPGTSVFGGLAQAHHELRRAPDEFAVFFLQDRLHIGNCYPAKFLSPRLQGDTHPVLPIPLTARSCKRFSGFKFNARHEEHGGAGVTDTLIPLALFALSGENKPDILTNLDEHPETKHPLDTVHGFFRRGVRAEHIGQPQALLRLRTHTGINYETGAVQSSILYNRQVLQENGMFWGCWWINDTLWEAFRTFSEEVAKSGLRLGNNRTRGLGLVRFNASPMEEERVAALRARVEAFTDLFKKQAGATGIDAPSAYYVPVLCTSDVILQDPLLRNRLQLQGTDLASYGIDGATLVFHAASTVHVQGWSSLWGLPKADDWAIGMGSVFLFALSQGDDATFAALQQLEQQGLGARRAEGFGMVSVANLFHIELAGGQFR